MATVMFLGTKSILLKGTIIAFCLAGIYSCSDDSMGVPSLVNIIADPGAYKGKRVKVHGYLGGSAFSLFISREHERMMDSSSSIAIINLDMRDSAISEYCGDHYAIVEGRVMKNPEAPFLIENQIGFYWIRDLERILVFSDEKLTQCWPPE